MIKYYLNISISDGTILFQGNGLTAYMVVETVKAFINYPIPFNENIEIKCCNEVDLNE